MPEKDSKNISQSIIVDKMQLNKWGVTSMKVTQIKLLLDDVLLNGFTDEEKRTKKYKEIVKRVREDFIHSLGGDEKSIKKDNKINLLSFKSIIIASVGAIATKTIEILFLWLQSLI
jgi:hypothetical protein